MLLLTLLACAADPIVDKPSDETGDSSSPDSGDTADSSPSDDTAESGDSADSADSGDSGETADPCAPVEGLAVQSATPSAPWGPNEAQVDVVLSSASAVAVTCTLDADPSDRHLVESTAAATTHTLRLSGLLGGATYTCAAQATCPAATGAPAAFALTTAADPTDIPAVTVTSTGADAGGYVLYNASDDCSWRTQLLLVADRAGRVRWSYRPPEYVGPSVEFRYHGDDLFAWGGGWEPNERGRPRLVDLYVGEVYDSAVAIPDAKETGFHHDGKLLDDGRFATLEEVNVRVGREPFRGYQVRLVDPDTDTVTVTYSSQRGLSEGELPEGSGDAWHANWVEVSDRGDHEELLVSLCNLGWTVAVDAATGDWLWTFGAGGDFSLVDASGAPLGDDEFPQCQHGLERVGDNLLVYDNGWSRGASRVSEYTLDLDRMEATLLWTWTERDWYETTLGDADWLPNGNVLVGAGHAECFSSNPGDRTTLLEIDPVTGDKPWELRFDTTGYMAYRSDWADGCELFARTSACPALATRWDELAPLFAE